MNPGPPALEASTILLGYRGGGEDYNDDDDNDDVVAAGDGDCDGVDNENGDDNLHVLLLIPLLCG